MKRGKVEMAKRYIDVDDSLDSSQNLKVLKLTVEVLVLDMH